MNSEEVESPSLFSLNLAIRKFAMAYAVSNQLRLGVLNQKNSQENIESTWAIAVQYQHNKDCLLKGRLDQNGVLNLFNRSVIKKKWALESFVETGLSKKHKINGLYGSNFAAGIKLVFDE